MNKKILVSGYIGFSNFGDDVMLEVLISHLKNMGCKIKAFSSNPELTKSAFDIKSVYYKNIFSLIYSLATTDILIFSGGNLLQNETSTQSLLYYIFIVFLAKLFLKKVIFYSNGIGPIYGAIPNFLTRLALKSADFISVRDVYSLQYLSDIKVQGELSSDAVWEYEMPDYEPKNIIGVQVRNFKNASKDLYKLIAENISDNLPDYEVRIFSFQNAQDMEECSKFQNTLSKINPNMKSTVISYTTPNNLAIEFSKLKYLIGMRYHANILGLKLGVKILPVSYSAKVRNFSKDFGIKYIEGDNPVNFNEVFREFISDDYKIKKYTRRYEWRSVDTIIKS